MSAKQWPHAADCAASDFRPCAEQNCKIHQMPPCYCHVAEIERLTESHTRLGRNELHFRERLAAAEKEIERLRGIIEDEAREADRRGHKGDARALRDRLENK